MIFDEILDFTLSDSWLTVQPNLDQIKMQVGLFLPAHFSKHISKEPIIVLDNFIRGEVSAKLFFVNDHSKKKGRNTNPSSGVKIPDPAGNHPRFTRDLDENLSSE